jgi:hypothetical protein
VVRHPDYRRIHPWLKPWLSAVGVKGIRGIFRGGLRRQDLDNIRAFIYKRYHSSSSL